jgi:hypothetical protein
MALCPAKAYLVWLKLTWQFPLTSGASHSVQAWARVSEHWPTARCCACSMCVAQLNVLLPSPDLTEKQHPSIHNHGGGGLPLRLFTWPFDFAPHAASASVQMGCWTGQSRFGFSFGMYLCAGRDTAGHPSPHPQTMTINMTGVCKAGHGLHVELHCSLIAVSLIAA